MSLFKNKISYSVMLRSAGAVLLSIGLLGCISEYPTDIRDLGASLFKPRNTHQVRKGETLFTIAKRHGVNIRVLAQINHLQPPYVIYPGQTLKLFRTDHRPVQGNVAGGARSSNQPSFRTPPPRVAKQSPPSHVKRAPAVVSPPRQSPSPTAFPKQTFSWIWPHRGPVLQGFAADQSKHPGINIGGKTGDPIRAAAKGRVVYSGNALRGYGNLIILKHDGNFLSAYAHNRKLIVKEGMDVQQGQTIAEMGQSDTEKVQLHFEVRYQGKPINPMRVLPKR